MTILAVALLESVFCNVVLICCVPWLFRRFFAAEHRLDEMQKQVDKLDEWAELMSVQVGVPEGKESK